jgi:hypothetical protein
MDWFCEHFPSLFSRRTQIMDDQETVFSRYPRAEAREEPPIFEHGEAAPIQTGHWAIFAGPDLELAELGRGGSESKAWADAARKMRITEAA